MKLKTIFLMIFLSGCLFAAQAKLSSYPCGTYSTPNSVITLTKGYSTDYMTVPSGACISIQAENVTIDCNGFSLIGSNLTQSYGIYSNKANTVVKNCIIKNFHVGIWYFGSVNSRIENSTIEVSKNRAYDPIFPSAVLISGYSHNVTINRVNASSWGNENYGSIYIYSGSKNVTIMNSNAYADYGNALGCHTDCNGIKIINCTGTSKTASGIYIDSGSSSVVVYNATMENSTGINFGQGSTNPIYLFSVSGSRIYNVTAISNATQGLAFAAYLLTNTTISNSRFIAYGQNSFSVHLNENSIGNTLINNTFASNSTIAQLYIHGGSSGNRIFWNHFMDSTGAYVNDEETNFYNTSINGIAQGNYWANVLNGSVKITDSNHDGWGDGGQGYPYSELTSLGKFIGSGKDYGPAVPMKKRS
jgi:hypothetical protein